MNKKTTYKRNPELLAVDMDGETVMMDMISGNYFGINTVGSHVWAVLETEHTVEEILKSLEGQFEISESDTVQSDIISFLDDMVKQKLVLVST